MDSVNVLWFFTIGVSTFGNLRVEAYLQLTAAYRSLSRPSSAPDAKAFTLCSYSLELPFLWSITFVAMIDPWFSFFRIAWVSWTFWLSLLACKKVCIIAFFLALFRIFHLSVKLYCTFVLPNFILGKTNKMCCFLFVLKYLFVFYSKHQFLHWFFPYSIVKDQFRTVSCAGRSGWTRTIDLALIRRAL